MQKLRPTDGTDPHLRTTRYHMRRCRQQKNTEPFKTLLQEGTQKYDTLQSQSRTVEDAALRLADLTSDVAGTEKRLENDVRDVEGDVARHERGQPALGIYKKILPDGLLGVIGPERAKQITPARLFLERMTPFLSLPGMQEGYDKVKSSTDDLESELKAREEEERKFKLAFSQEQSCREAVRAQLTSAHGRLNDYFQSNPLLAESYFIPDPRKGSTALADATTRGRITGKFEALLFYLEKKDIALSDQEQEKHLTNLSEEKIDLWLGRAYSGASLEDIFAAPPEEEKKV